MTIANKMLEKLNQDNTELTYVLLNIQGFTIRVAIRKSIGYKKPLLICNGIASPIEMLETFQACFPERTVILFDTPGVGGSDLALFPLTLKKHAEIIQDIIVQLKYDSVDILGVSWGGLLAQEFVKQFPDSSHKLILMMTSNGASSILAPFDIWMDIFKPKRFIKKIWTYVALPLQSRDWVGHMFEFMSQHILTPKAWYAFACQTVTASTWSSVFWLHKLDIPTLVIAAESDRVIPEINQRILADCLPKSQFKTIKGGHFILTSQPKKLAALVKTFI